MAKPEKKSEVKWVSAEVYFSFTITEKNKPKAKDILHQALSIACKYIEDNLEFNKDRFTIYTINQFKVDD